jgi:hypothetical protein
MTRRFRRWMCVVVVPDLILWTALACVFATWIAQRLLNQWLAVFAPDLNEHEMVLVTRPAHVFAIFPFATLYGFYRAAVFHPVASRSYGTWLAQTPWRYPQPLPLGPLAFVWQDLVVIALLLSPAVLPPYGERELLYGPIILFVVAYCGYLAYVNWLLRAHWAWVAFVLLASALLLVVTSPIGSSVVALVMYLVTYFGTADGLRDFPYNERRRAELGFVTFERRVPPDVAWPISPADERNWLFSVGYGHALTLGLMVGVLFFSGSFYFRHETRFVRGLMSFHLVIAAIAVIARLIIYLAGCWPPISLFGRVATRRLIVPGYDVAFLCPLVTAAIAFVLPLALIWLGLAPIIAVPLSTAVTIVLAVSLPPKLEKWYYSGHHRVPTVRRIGRDFVKS